MASRSTGKTSRGKKNRKHGRNGRDPGQVRYNSEHRWETNKARRIEQNARKSRAKKDKAA